MRHRALRPQVLRGVRNQLPAVANLAARRRARNSGRVRGRGDRAVVAARRGRPLGGFILRRHGRGRGRRGIELRDHDHDDQHHGRRQHHQQARQVGQLLHPFIGGFHGGEALKVKRLVRQLFAQGAVGPGTGQRGQN
ncbi:hypothetical protein [Hymenobacter sp. GOD-10R]|uniref:hypothetical protein n=1 Tax=Hymenobacter sp. GOD-10R TaxID=3093922 RepID=UPI002D791AB8|nr:hypothetical protein [Hymenobacter sp. GOD-10R]WRQ31359.1 hypothetical protein SD425_27105 [Hymenobacter sp. GOD-10R]